MKNQTDKITGVILSGGRNSRFGSEKALVNINGKRIIERIIAEMKEVFSHNIIIANDEELYREFNLKIYPDVVKGKGPLVGIYTALYNASTDIFVTACDMPFVSSIVIRKIIDNLEGYDAVIPKYGGKLHFLHAAYSLRCFEIFKNKIDRDSLRLKDMLKELNCTIIEEFNFDSNHLSPFFNMNTPDDFILAKNDL